MGKQLSTLVLCLILSFAVPHGWHTLIGGFSPRKVLFNIPNRPEWETQFPPHLDLPNHFFYLGKGLQCHVFEDPSQTFVLKIFRKNLKKCRSQQDFLKKISKTFNACKLAYERLPKETGLIALHLNQTKNRLSSARFYDHLGIAHELPLDQLHFVVQKKARPFSSTLSQATPDEARVLIESFFDLIETRISQGISNTDCHLSSNFGFIGNCAVEIDFGDYIDHSTEAPPSDWTTAERIRFHSTFYHWLERHAPEYLTLAKK